MDKDHYNSFLDLSENAIQKHVSSGMFHVRGDSLAEFASSEATLSRLSNSLRKGVENIDEELNKFENSFVGKNTTIFWASTYNDVFDSLKKIFKTYKVKSVRIPNVNASTIFREIGIKYFLRDEKIELKEDADMQFFVADFMFSDTGTLLLLNQTNNNLAKIDNRITNVFFSTIDRIVSNSNWVEVFQQLLSYRNGGSRQDMILFRSTPNCDNYLFIIDNQRTSLLQNTDLRQSLTCIQCGRCNDVCPVYQTIGDVPYNNVFAGPIANVMLPYLESFDTYAHVSLCCTLCGHCEEVCPLSIPIRDMIVSNRNYIFKNNVMGRHHRRMMTALEKFYGSRSKMNASRFHKKHLLHKHISSGMKQTRRLVDPAKESFNKSFRKTNDNVQ